MDRRLLFRPLVHCSPLPGGVVVRAIWNLVRRTCRLEKVDLKGVPNRTDNRHRWVGRVDQGDRKNLR